MTDESFKKFMENQRFEEFEAECQTHGKYMAKKIYFMPQGTAHRKTGCPECMAIEKAKEQERKEREEAEQKRQRYEKFLGVSNIPHRFKERNFDNFLAANAKQEKALSVCKKFSEEFEQNYKLGKSLILSGKPGTGKSHLATAIIHSLYPKAQGQYMTLMELIRLVRGTWHKNSDKSEAQVLKELIYIDLLVIDEIGVQYGTDGEQNIIFDVLDGRYREQMPTILLTNQDKEGLAKCIGERVFDRLRETATWVSFDWESYRPKAR